MKFLTCLLLLLLPLLIFAQQEEPTFGGRAIDVNLIADVGGAIGLSSIAWSDDRKTPVTPLYSLGGELLFTTRYAGIGIRADFVFGNIRYSANASENIDFFTPSYSFVLAMQPVEHLVFTAGPVYAEVVLDPLDLPVSNFLLADHFWGLSFTTDYALEKWILGVRTYVGLQPIIRLGGTPQEVTGRLRSFQLKVGYNLL